MHKFYPFYIAYLFIYAKLKAYLKMNNKRKLHGFGVLVCFADYFGNYDDGLQLTVKDFLHVSRYPKVILLSYSHNWSF